MNDHIYTHITYLYHEMHDAKYLNILTIFYHHVIIRMQTYTYYERRRTFYHVSTIELIKESVLVISVL
jgi:hypothetical protein